MLQIFVSCRCMTLDSSVSHKQWITISIFAQKKLQLETTARKVSSKYANVFLYHHRGFLLQNHIASRNPNHINSESEFEALVPISTDDGAECIFCHSLFSQDKCGKGRFQCTRCKKWGHCDFAWNSENVNFIYHMCLNC